MKLCIDTNYFLDFYRAGKDSLKVLDEISGYGSHIVFPEQVYREFRRSAQSVLEREIEVFDKGHTNGFALNPSQLVRDLPEYEAYERAKKELRERTKEILKVLKGMSADRDMDKIYQHVETLYLMPGVEQLKTSPEIIERAKNRQLLGDPPGTNTISIGDEVIWEVLLEYVSDDLIIVTGDKSFTNNFRFLSDEFYEVTGKDLFIFSKLSDAIKKLGESPSDDLIEFERESEFERLSELQLHYILENLPEYKEYRKGVKDSGGKVVILIENYTIYNDRIHAKFYVGEETDTHIARWNTFLVDLLSEHLMIIDPITNEPIDTEKWRSDTGLDQLVKALEEIKHL
jgi:predicted nucleic acid-binding protein